ncbi:MAG: EVE domain-containing protein [Pseudomonadota bacterium]
MNYWLFKTEPEDYSWDMLVDDGRTEWDGVRNYQAAANMRSMRKGDTAFFYRSLKNPAIVGTMTVVREAYPDPDDKSGKFVRVDVAANRPVVHEVSLKAIKSRDDLSDLALVRQSRLSVMPVSPKHWHILCQMAGLES